MKTIKCSNPRCKEVSWVPDYWMDEGWHKTVEVMDDYEGPAYCSITCYCVATGKGIREVFK